MAVSDCKNIVVVDLDNTLLNIDSFNFFLNVQLKKSFLKVLFIKSLRKLKVFNPADYKHYIVKNVYNKLSASEKDDFVNQLNLYLNKELFNEINTKYKSTSEIIILSASPDQYVHPFAHQLGWKGFGSYYDEASGKYYHLHSNGKIKFILRRFPRNEFNYVYAISDSKSDLNLLKMFQNYDLYVPSKSKCYDT